MSINISPNGLHADSPTSTSTDSGSAGSPDASTPDAPAVPEGATVVPEGVTVVPEGATVLTLPTPPALPGQPAAAPISRAAVDLPVSAEVAWPVLSDPQRLAEWFTIHDDWHTDLPAELATGAELVQQITLTGWSGAISWKVIEYRSPNLLRLKGTGLRDGEVTLELTVEPTGYWSKVVAEMGFTGPAAKGAAGIALELGGTRELEASLANLQTLVAP